MWPSRALAASAALAVVPSLAAAQGGTIPSVQGDRDVCIQGCYAAFVPGTPAFEECIALCNLDFVVDLTAVLDQDFGIRPPIPWLFRADPPWANGVPGYLLDPTPTPMIPVDPDFAVLGLGAFDLNAARAGDLTLSDIFGPGATPFLQIVPATQAGWTSVRMELDDFNGKVTDVPEQDIAPDDFGQYLRIDLTQSLQDYPDAQPVAVRIEAESPSFVNNDNPSGVIIIIGTILPTQAAAADLASPIGLLTFADISEFLAKFTNEDGLADLVDPFGAFTFADISAFLSAFNDG